MQPDLLTISEEEWLDRFRPQLNHLDTDSAVDFGDGGASFETCGEELNYVRGVDPARVWTMYDDGSTICSGYHFVNRLHYFVCKVPVPAGEHYILELLDDLNGHL